jgi:hypothetical protein
LSRRLILGVAALAALAGPARAEVKIADLVGHSLKISWHNTIVVKTEDGGEDTRNATTNMTLYVGEQRHVFERVEKEADRCAHKCRGQVSSEAEHVHGLGALGGEGQWTFEQGALVKMIQLPEGARRVVVSFEGASGALACAVALRDLHKSGDERIVSLSIAGAPMEVISHTISGESCEVVQGNLLAQ